MIAPARGEMTGFRVYRRGFLADVYCSLVESYTVGVDNLRDSRARKAAGEISATLNASGYKDEV